MEKALLSQDAQNNGITLILFGEDLSCEFCICLTFWCEWYICCITLNHLGIISVHPGSDMTQVNKSCEAISVNIPSW